MTQTLRIGHREDVMHVVLQRADKGNALSGALVEELAQAVEAARQAQVRLFVLSGEGRHFCTGFDLSALDEETDDSLLARFTRVELLLQALHAAPFTTLAIAHGRTTGAGADIFCACAERWTVGDTTFAFPGAAFGLVLGTARLADAVGATRTREWIESGMQFGDDIAFEAGLATRRLAPEALDEALAQLAARSRRLDAPTQRGIHEAIDAAGRRPRGDAGDAQDLMRLVRSAARAGLRDRIAAYRAAQKRG
ncbi:enoyl-CoA hydratase/carnithine racemase [Variovorax boronicumulans]|uniref:Enoyl-CoA hydratase/carnithine racemase n=1 Tax=Variovorax boronicumulans TaxID=436515 RepID=A0AAW8DTV3_9BURK|nr:enoyl-CoA hydratase/isomerase family protein [Variovorax boronicumulans]MDP9877594.1 enoyl-CoA hydratase/carnithine racemase [Variovorax boronicumulans]MDP9917428.1 enoyl-CoA hydratase/carnithine racemase [Variovorax boronicumulans]MDP9922879.1 enoyl-CoA hydratase/carnithine racemase [Variovorax boronicumulans]